MEINDLHMCYIQVTSYEEMVGYDTFPRLWEHWKKALNVLVYGHGSHKVAVYQQAGYDIFSWLWEHWKETLNMIVHVIALIHAKNCVWHRQDDIFSEINDWLKEAPFSNVLFPYGHCLSLSTLTFPMQKTPLVCFFLLQIHSVHDATSIDG